MTASAKSLWVACAWSVTAAMAGRSGGLLPACSVALLALAATLWLGRAGPWIWAWPAAFAAGIPPAPVLPPRPGPVHVAGRVLGPVHFDPVERLCSCQVQHHGQVFGCLVLDTDRDSVVLPGDQVQGPAHYAARPMRRRRGGIPQVRTTRDALRVSPPGPGTWTLPRFATACRLGMQGALLDAVPGEAGRLLCLLTLGSGPRLAHDLPAAHRATGLSHLLAVSGAHLTMLG